MDQNVKKIDFLKFDLYKDYSKPEEPEISEASSKLTIVSDDSLENTSAIIAFRTLDLNNQIDSDDSTRSISFGDPLPWPTIRRKKFKRKKPKAKPKGKPKKKLPLEMLRPSLLPYLADGIPLTRRKNVLLTARDIDFSAWCIKAALEHKVRKDLWDDRRFKVPGEPEEDLNNTTKPEAPYHKYYNNTNPDCFLYFTRMA